MSVSVALVFLDLFFIATMINISFCNGNPCVGCVDSEREALLKLKQDLKDPSSRLASWNIRDEDCCAWDGVVCNNFTGHVLQLNLGNPNPNNGTGPKLAGKINPSLVDLKHLIHLDLSGNDFHGIQIPKYLGSLKNLRYLNLSRAKFAGVIPYQLGNLSNLQYLDLSENYESQVESFSWLSGLSLLEHLDLSEADLSKATDWLLVTNSLSSLKVLKLSYCELHHFPPSSSANFSSLKTLDLSKNQLNNSLFQFSSWVFGLHNLVFFDLSGNQFQGKIPIGLGNLTFLRHLDLSYNEFNSAIPENLTSIKTLDLSLNYDLAGKIPTSFVRLCKLTSIDLSFVKLSQDLSEVLDIFSACGAHALESLVLRSCQFSGHLTNQLGQFKSLNRLRLRNNSLSGPLPSALGELTYLTYLDLSKNRLNGSIPLSVGQILNLEYLDLSNNLLNGSIPLSLGKFSHLEYLDLSNNRMSGTLSENHFVNLTKLTSFSTSGNPLILQVNPNWVPPFQLDTLKLRSCHLGPHFPSWLHSQKHLSFLDISNTRISETIPRWFWNSIFQYIYLNLSSNQIYGNNNLTGSLPTSIGTLSSLLTLNLRNNRFSGVIPESFQNCSSLVSLDMGENEFVGNIPTWMGERFSGLSILILRSNKFHGDLPIQLCRLTSLQILDVAYNNLSGTIPRCIGNFTAIATTDSSLLGNAISYIAMMDESEVVVDASVVTKGSMVEYNSILNLVRSIDISKNNFSGEIPMELTNLKGLQSLNLSHNFFTSKIPEKIGDMKSIESLDFSANQLSGKIPQSMSSLSFLNHLNLSNNHLTGKIPSSTQLQSFDASCFAGNNLCGAPLPNCNENNPLVPEDPNGNGNEDEDEVDWLFGVLVFHRSSTCQQKMEVQVLSFFGWLYRRIWLLCKKMLLDFSVPVCLLYYVLGVQDAMSLDQDSSIQEGY
ncbi:hypothetical protein CICLE_v10029857mg [Citrus x clementina]|uniref:Uncharacterized protein n=1 Tax=Citrus clementina TaxID=85681 RepID=V4SAB2_CITCL|nr:hypothetical protein CICLE_v10029857mg [Citrus x clementina]